MSEQIRFIIAGGGARSDYLYAPLFKMLSDELELAGIWSRSTERARFLGEKHAVPWSTDLQGLIKETKAQAAIVSVNYHANGEVGRLIVDSGLHALLETPIAHHLWDADAIIAGAKAQDLKIEVAEQYYRRPIERLKRLLIDAGLFGRINAAYNDFMGHGYHGVSLIRSYIGFDVPVLSVSGDEEEYGTASYYAWISQTTGRQQEQWQHGVLRFDGGRLGFFNWSGIAYDSPLRWLRSTKFFGEIGMGVGDRLTLLTPDGKDPQPIEIERRIHNVGGMETLRELVATIPNPVSGAKEIVWRNPFRQYYMDDEMIAVADCLMSLVNAIRSGTQPEYGPQQARLDQEIVLAMQASARNNHQPVRLPYTEPEA
ncbi:MAG: Gfo/Idh/MocA family protein [Omnitrophica WOR_2 bacterium]